MDDANRKSSIRGQGTRRAFAAFLWLESDCGAKPARLLAVIIVDDADKQLTIPDAPEKGSKEMQVLRRK